MIYSHKARAAHSVTSYNLACDGSFLVIGMKSYYAFLFSKPVIPMTDRSGPDAGTGQGFSVVALAALTLILKTTLASSSTRLCFPRAAAIAQLRHSVYTVILSMKSLGGSVVIFSLIGAMQCY